MRKNWLKRVASIYFAANLALMPTVSAFASEESQTFVEEIQGEVIEEEIQQEAWAGYTGLVNVGGNQWRYLVNGAIQWNYTGLVKYYGTWYYIEKGVLNWNYTGLTNYYGTWYYVEKGVLNWSYTGLTNYYGTWYYVEKGVLNWGYTGLTNYYGIWYYVEKGVLNWSYTGLTNYYGTWYYVEKGVLNWSYTGLTNYYGTWYYVEKGVLNWNYTGFTNYYGTQYYVENGVLNWNYTAHKLEDFLGTYCINTNLRKTGYPMGNVDVIELLIVNGKLDRWDRMFRNSSAVGEHYLYDSYKIEGNKLICSYSRVYGPRWELDRIESGTDIYIIDDNGDLKMGGDTLYRYEAKKLTVNY